MSEWLANLKWPVVLVVVIALASIRLVFGKNKSQTAQQVADISESLAIAIALVFLLIRPFLVQVFYIPSGSMRPTLLERDRLVVNKFVYRFSEPKAGDIVVFRAPESAVPDGKQRDFIKRVVGVPGDTIKAVPGYVKIDGAVLHHSELRALLLQQTDSGDVHIKLSRNGVFVSGKAVDKTRLAIAANRPKAKVEIHPGYIVRNGKRLEEPYINEDPDASFDQIRVSKGHLFMMGDNRNFSNDSRYWGELDRDRVEGKAMFVFWPLNRIRLIK